MIFGNIFRFFQNRWIYSTTNRYVNYLRKQGIHIGENFHIAANGPLRNIVIDVTRPTLITIGNNVCVNKNFTLFTHDFVSGVFLHKYKDFIPSSGKVKIGNNVRFGANCIVLKNVEIGDNCFIAAGSIVTHDIPANSLAAGVPCKVIKSIDSYYELRKKDCVKEAFEYANTIRERFGRDPEPKDFWEEFPLFVDRTNISDYPKIPIKSQLKEAYPSWLENHVALFKSFEEFLHAADSYLNDSSNSMNSFE